MRPEAAVRRKEREIAERGRVEELLAEARVGRLGTVGPDGCPMVKPLNFVYSEGRIYFHTAPQGEKIDHLAADPRVCFEVDLPLAYVPARTQPCEATYLYRSAIATGRAELVEDEAERRRALDLLMAKYQPGQTWAGYPAAKWAVTAVFRVDVERLTGKEHLGGRSKDG